MAAIAATAEERGVCKFYEVCQCQSGPEENSTTCVKGTCRFDEDLGPLTVCHYLKPHCRHWLHWPSWQNCQWANFYKKAGNLPGDNNLLVAIPTKSITPELLAGLSSITVFTDLDDTVLCSGGTFANFDMACEGTSKGFLYPGVAEFMLAVTRGPSGNLPLKKVIPLSARPVELKPVVRIRESDEVNQAFKAVGGSDWGMDVDNACYGKIADMIDPASEFAGQAGLTPFRRFGYTKYKGWHKVVRKVLGNGSSVFMGDDGQGDLVGAQMMMKTGKLLAAFIHDVRGKCQEEECRTAWAAYGIFLFSNYVEAAAIARAQGLISAEGCQSVCEAKGVEGYACRC